MTRIRYAEERDVGQIAELYRAAYGEEYPFKQFYDSTWIKRGVFDREIRWFVADEGGRLLGSSAVMLNAGDADDQVCEIGRLGVHPDGRGRGLASRLVAAVTADAERYGDFSFAECRTAHLGSQIIFDRADYAVVGVEPLAYAIDGHESVVFVCRFSDVARALRRPRPSVVPAAQPLATASLEACGFAVDAEGVDIEPYPVDADAQVVSMVDGQVYRLLKLSREQFLNPEVFGAFRLEYGHLKVVEHDGRYLILNRREQVAGGLGYTWDPTDRKVEIFELVGVDEAARGTLIALGLEAIEAEHDPRWLAIDVGAHATRLQASLVELGFAPVAYAPSMVYHAGERLDVIKMVKLRQPPEMGHWKLLESVSPIAELVEAAVHESHARTRRQGR